MRSICEWKLSASGGWIISEGAQPICDNGSCPQRVHMIFIILSGGSERWMSSKLKKNIEIVGYMWLEGSHDEGRVGGNKEKKSHMNKSLF